MEAAAGRANRHSKANSCVRSRLHCPPLRLTEAAAQLAPRYWTANSDLYWIANSDLHLWQNFLRPELREEAVRLASHYRPANSDVHFHQNYPYPELKVEAARLARRCPTVSLDVHFPQSRSHLELREQVARPVSH